MYSVKFLVFQLLVFSDKINIHFFSISVKAQISKAQTSSNKLCGSRKYAYP